MADATMYDPKNVSGITTLYVTNDANAPIYKQPYSTGEIAAFDGFTGGSGYSAGTVTPTGGTGTGATATKDVFKSQAQVVKAMEDSRYEKDPAYRQEIYDKLERSNLQF